VPQQACLAQRPTSRNSTSACRVLRACLRSIPPAPSTKSPKTSMSKKKKNALCHEKSDLIANQCLYATQPEALMSGTRVGRDGGSLRVARSSPAREDDIHPHGGGHGRATHQEAAPTTVGTPLAAEAWTTVRRSTRAITVISVAPKGQLEVIELRAQDIIPARL
jgi:hypothetical protein